jgi:hypothetical protein
MLHDCFVLKSEWMALELHMQSCSFTSAYTLHFTHTNTHTHTHAYTHKQIRAGYSCSDMALVCKEAAMAPVCELMDSVCPTTHTSSLSQTLAPPDPHVPAAAASAASEGQCARDHGSGTDPPTYVSCRAIVHGCSRSSCGLFA